MDELTPENLKKAERYAQLTDDSQLVIMDAVDELEAKVEQYKQEIPDLDRVLASVRGEKGEKGDQGGQGEMGPEGPQGESIVGPQGPRGPKGEKGDRGERGPKGASVVGPQGIQGPKGETGENGKDGSPDTGEDIVKKINDLDVVPEKQIDAKHIKNLDQHVESKVQYMGSGYSGIKDIVAGTGATVSKDGNNVVTIGVSPDAGAVDSVNGQTGDVSLTTTDIPEGDNGYYTYDRFSGDFSSMSTSELQEGSNLYFTNERAQDAVGTILTDTSSIDFTYNDASNTISAVVLPAGVDHNSLANLTTGDSHTQYALLAGRTGGQTLIGGSGGLSLEAGGTNQNVNITPSGTGYTYVPSGNIRVGVTNNLPSYAMAVNGTGGIGIYSDSSFAYYFARFTTANALQSYISQSASALNIVNNVGNTFVTISARNSADTAIVEGVRVRFNAVTINENANDLDFRVEGTSNANLFFTDAGNNRVAVGTGTPDRIFHVMLDDATNNAVSYATRLSHTTSGTPANGIGVGLELEVETSAGNNEVGATIEAVANDVTAGSEDFELRLKVMIAGAAASEVARFDGSTTATHTRFMIYDVDNGTLERVTVGAADSGGAGFKVLRIPN